ncbi:MAG: trimeric intracellular cation channel family protein [Paracoccaceae bacterium]
MIWLDALDYASVFVFALTGALVASRAQLDLIGFVFIACLTAVGGGTVRDVILDRGVFWVQQPLFVGVATVAAIIVFFTAHLLESRYRVIVWLDALALAVAVPAGVAAAFAMDAPPLVVVVMGISTGCFGGLMRDVVCNEVPLVLKQGELYVTCALVGAVTAVLIGGSTGLIVCAGVVFVLRAGSVALGWRLPVYKSRPPRP